MEIGRDSYLDKLTDRMGNGLVKLTTGVRRYGKMWLLLKLFRRHLARAGVEGDHVIAVMLDNLENAERRAPNIMPRHIKSRIADGGMHYVLLNEVQLLRRLALKGKRYIASAAKYCFEGIGLRNARLGFRQTEENHVMENIIYDELRLRGYHVDVGVLEAFGKEGPF